MIKKALQVATAFGLLLAGYAGYVRVFAIVVAKVAPPRTLVALDGPRTGSETLKKSIRLGVEAFGEGHWTTDTKLSRIRYYNALKGYWMYARDYERLDEGRRLRLKTFALIWEDRGGKGLKTATSDEAIIDLDRPLGGVSKPGDPQLHVVHAQLTGNVLIRDNKGTPRLADDDLTIGPMPYIEYDEPTLQIRSESEVVLVDRDMRVTGLGLLIALRPKEPGAPSDGGAAGFNGAKTIYLKKSPHVVIQDVGEAGVLPGKAKSAPGQQGERTQLDVRSQGPLQIDLPEPRLPVKVGPAAPPDPTFATFTRDVRVLRGKVGQRPDQLNSDHLRLTLLPAPKAVPAAAAPGEAPEGEPGTEGTSPAAGGPGTELALREATASGHAVWLESPDQGTKARCNELIYKKLLPERPDETYLRGDETTKLIVEKEDRVAEGPKKGEVETVTTIRSIDATIFDDGREGGPGTIVSRGPGILETRPARDKPVERTASWEDELVMVDELTEGKPTGKRITLTGRPKFVDTAQASLDARKEIIVWLKPNPAAAAQPAAPAAGPPVAGLGAKVDPEVAKASAVPSGSYQIERLKALDDVHLIAPGRVMTARKDLSVVFSNPPVVTSAPSPGPASAPSPAPASAPAPGGDRPAEGAASPAPSKEEKPSEPNVSVNADRVWASILMKPGAGEGNQKGEVQEVRLRGGVEVHQDAAPGKARGTDVAGEAIDMINQGDGRSKFKVFGAIPDPTRPRRGALDDLTRPIAKVVTDEFTIEGPEIGLDQKADRAWVDGPGNLVQLTDRGLLTDKGIAPDAPAPEAGKAEAVAGKEAEAKKVPLTITWKQDMKFSGQSVDLKGNAAGRADFSGGVVAKHGNDGLLVCEHMTTYMDRPVSLARPSRKDGAGAGDPGFEEAAPEPRPQIAFIDCTGNVKAVNRKVDATGRRVQEQQRIDAEHLTYDKPTGEFQAYGKGVCYLYDLETGETKLIPVGAPARRTVLPAANPAGAGRPTPIIGRSTVGAPGSSDRPSAKEKAKAAPAPAMTLTQIKFRKGMRGRFGSGKERDRTETRQADFFRDVEVMHMKVANTSQILDFDLEPLPAGAFFLTSEILRVVSEPQPGAADTPPRNFLKAWGEVNARTEDKTILADVLTYDSLNELFYAYGEEGRDVTISQQAGRGQPSSVMPGRAVRYNRKSGESQVIDPRSFVFLDAKTGKRPTPVGPPVPEVKPTKPPRTPLRVPSRNNQERRGFNGR